MRGDRDHQAEMLLALTPEQLVPADHPIRRIKAIVEPVLTRLSPRFDEMYAERGRPSIPPEHLLKASLLIALFSVRSERQFCERLHYDLLFKWFLDLNVADRAFDPSTFSKNRERLLAHDVAGAFFVEVVAEAKRRRLLSADHFTVDGTLLEAWASLKSYRPRDEQDPPAGSGGRNPEVDFRGQRRRRDTHVSRTDPEAQLATKGSGQTAKLCYLGHVLTENRHGLVVGVALTEADGHAERAAALRLLDGCVRGRATLGADRAYDTRDFVAGCRQRRVTPHVAQHTRGRRSAIDGRTTRHAGYALSQRLRKRVEEVFGWEKTVGGLRKLRYIGRARNELCAKITAAAYNLVRMAKLETVPAS
jgi:transposase